MSWAPWPSRTALDARAINIDLAAYELIQNPARFDVIVAPNLFGDIIADLGGVLLSSRGVTFSGNFDPRGRAVYQTNHGCARDLAGTDTANPVGQLFSLTMMLRESFGLEEAAALIENSVARVWRAGWRHRRPGRAGLPDCRHESHDRENYRTNPAPGRKAIAA